MEDVFAYTKFLDFWRRATPETPYGKDALKEPHLFFDVGQLEKIYDETEALIYLLKELQDDPARLSLISHHLKQLPRLPFGPHQSQKEGSFDEIELFQIKKFLHNYRALMAQLPPKAQRAFGFEYCSQGLEERLNVGQLNPESFYVADAYSPELQKIRREILEADEAVQRLETERAAEILKKFGLDFCGQPFLLAPKAKLGDLASASKLLAIEPYDDALFYVRPLRCAASLATAEKRLELAQRERACEMAVLESLSQGVCKEMPNLDKYIAAALGFDLAWARARMAVELNLTRPILHTKNSISIDKGRFPPCESTCAKHGLKYFPLDAHFESSATVIFGSNMGGKTIVLQTAAFLQLAAQAGLFVPAAQFETRLFHNFHYIGELHSSNSSQEHRGLSGFGMEMQQLIKAWQSIAPDDSGTMLLMDEFARTTSSKESEALLAAVLEAISKRTNTIALCSTHFHRVPHIPSVNFLRMAGFNKITAHAGPNTDPISGIAECMDYRLVPDDGKQSSDAIAIAQILGLDGELAGRAEVFFGEAQS
ncbi:MAG: hypothetical protein LBC63_00010 [Holophagales bacterium]|jgi:dsDNA-specific endonuclease/ATPase MutS2|nr:hypothetical protein [Holophagales bacterium]